TEKTTYSRSMRTEHGTNGTWKTNGNPPSVKPFQHRRSLTATSATSLMFRLPQSGIRRKRMIASTVAKRVLPIWRTTLIRYALQVEPSQTLSQWITPTAQMNHGAPMTLSQTSQGGTILLT